MFGHVTSNRLKAIILRLRPRRVSCELVVSEMVDDAEVLLGEFLQARRIRSLLARDEAFKGTLPVEFDAPIKVALSKSNVTLKDGQDD